MDWIRIAIASGSGALAAVIAQAAIGFKRERKALYVLVLVIAFFGIRFVAATYRAKDS